MDVWFEFWSYRLAVPDLRANQVEGLQERDWGVGHLLWLEKSTPPGGPGSEAGMHLFVFLLEMTGVY